MSEENNQEDEQRVAVRIGFFSLMNGEKLISQFYINENQYVLVDPYGYFEMEEEDEGQAMTDKDHESVTIVLRKFSICPPYGTNHQYLMPPQSVSMLCDSIDEGVVEFYRDAVRKQKLYVTIGSQTVDVEEGEHSGEEVYTSPRYAQLVEESEDSNTDINPNVFKKGSNPGVMN